MPDVDCSGITELVETECEAWTSCWTEVKVLNKTALVIISLSQLIFNKKNECHDHMTFMTSIKSRTSDSMMSIKHMIF